MVFRDDNSIGMKGYAKSKRGRHILSTFPEKKDSASFRIPTYLKKSGELEIYAVDKDGNESEHTKVYAVDGVILVNPPPTDHPDYKEDFAPVLQRLSEKQFISFADNFAPGMKAFTNYRGRRVELSKVTPEKYSCSFVIPNYIARQKSFEVYAIDRDGNQSEPVKIEGSIEELLSLKKDETRN
jgi:hypothetical protein